MSWLLSVATAIGAIVKIIEDCIDAVNSWEEFRDSHDRRAHEALKRKLEEQRDELEREKRLAEREDRRSRDDQRAARSRGGESDSRLVDAKQRAEWVRSTLYTSQAILVKEVLLQSSQAVKTTEDVLRDGGIVDRETAQERRGGGRDGAGTSLASILASGDIVLSPARLGRGSRDVWGTPSAAVPPAMPAYGEGIGRDGGGTTLSSASGRGRQDLTRRTSEYGGYSVDPYGRPYTEPSGYRDPASYNTESSYRQAPYGAQSGDPYREPRGQAAYAQSPTDPAGRADATPTPDSRGGYPSYPARDVAQRYPAYATSGTGPGYPTGERDATPRTYNTETDQYGRPVEMLSRARSEPTWVWDERTRQYYDAANTAQRYP